MQHDNGLETLPVGKLLRAYTLPAVAAMLVESIYYFVDAVFVGRGVGPGGLAALSICMPVIQVQVAVGMMIGIGAGTLAAIHQGRRQPERARGVFSRSMVLMLAAALLIMVPGVLGAGPMVRMLGAEGEVVSLAATYLRVYLLFTPALLVVFGLSCFVRNDGAPRLVLVASLVGALVNIPLDAFFIFGLHWGVSGAAVASGLSMILQLCIYLPHFLRKKGALYWGGERLRGDSVRIVRMGMPAAVIEICLGLCFLMYNLRLVGLGGTSLVAVYSIVGNVVLLFVLIAVGIGQGMQPVVSHNHGAGHPGRCREALVLSLAVVGITGGLAMVTAEIIPQFICRLFLAHAPDIEALAVPALRISCLAMPFMGLGMVGISFLQAVERPGAATVFSLLRGLVFVAAGIALLPCLLGINGVWLSLPLAEAATVLLMLVWARREGGAVRPARRQPAARSGMRVRHACPEDR